MAIDDVSAGTLATPSYVNADGQINFQGLGSGPDFSTVITKLVQVEQTRVKTYVTWKQSWQDKNTAFQAINTQMLSLRTTLKGMDSVNSFLAKTATSSNTGALTATANGSVDSGTYTYSIKQLAQNKIMVTSSGYASLTQNINPGAAAKLVYTYEGVTVSNTIPSAATLTDLMNIINANPLNKGVRASTLFDGTNNYLQLRGLDMGSNANIVISNSSTLPGFGNGNFVVTQQNQNALFKVNGWPVSNAYISRSTNSVSDVINGLTLSFTAAGSGTITVNTDVNAVLSNVRTFVNQVNTVKQEILSLTKYDSTAKQGSILTGNYGLDMIGTDFDNITASPGVGFGSSDIYSSLAAIGITTNADESSPTFGQLILDQAQFQTVLASNANAVAQIFSGYYIGATSSADISYSSYIDNITAAGVYNVNYTISNGKVVSATMNGHPASFSSNSFNITGGSGYPESGLVVQVDNRTNGSYSHNVYLKLGKTGELANELTTLTDPNSGPLNILQQNYGTIMNDIQSKIDSENARIATMAQHLQDQFSRLDTLLGKYSNIQTQLSSQIAGMAKST